MSHRPIVLAVSGFIAAYLVALALAGLLAQPRPGDLAVVLGNDLRADGTPVPRLQARLDAALAVYRAGLVPAILVSGGVEPGNRDEAAAMATYLAERGVPRSAIVEDPRGVNTMATARDTAALVDGTRRIVIVTQWFHVPRSVLAMRLVGFHDVSAAWPRFVEGRDVFSFLREAVALPVYALRPIVVRAWSG